MSSRMFFLSGGKGVSRQLPAFKASYRKRKQGRVWHNLRREHCRGSNEDGRKAEVSHMQLAHSDLSSLTVQLVALFSVKDPQVWVLDHLECDAD